MQSNSLQYSYPNQNIVAIVQKGKKNNKSVNREVEEGIRSLKIQYEKRKAITLEIQTDKLLLL